MEKDSVHRALCGESRKGKVGEEEKRWGRCDNQLPHLHILPALGAVPQLIVFVIYFKIMAR